MNDKMKEMNLLPEVKAWYKIIDFIEKNDIEFKEAKDGVFYPDFSPWVESSKNKADIKIFELNKKYIDTWTEYINACKFFFKGVKYEIDNNKKLF